jgi:hypothetical protein
MFCTNSAYAVVKSKSLICNLEMSNLAAYKNEYTSRRLAFNDDEARRYSYDLHKGKSVIFFIKSVIFYYGEHSQNKFCSDSI